MRYRGGTATYLEVLDSQRSLFNAELTLAQARNNDYQSLVQLYKAAAGSNLLNLEDPHNVRGIGDP